MKEEVILNTLPDAQQKELKKLGYEENHAFKSEEEATDIYLNQTKFEKPATTDVKPSGEGVGVHNEGAVKESVFQKTIIKNKKKSNFGTYVAYLILIFLIGFTIYELKHNKQPHEKINIAKEFKELNKIIDSLSPNQHNYIISKLLDKRIIIHVISEDNGIPFKQCFNIIYYLKLDTGSIEYDSNLNIPHYTHHNPPFKNRDSVLYNINLIKDIMTRIENENWKVSASEDKILSNYYNLTSEKIKNIYYEFLLSKQEYQLEKSKELIESLDAP